MSNIKKCFVSRFGEQGYIVEADLSQIEVVVQAYLANDPQMKQDVRDGMDFHCKRLAYKLGEIYEDVLHKAKVLKVPHYVEQRTSAKGISFQKAYGAGIPAIAESVGIPKADVKAIFEAEDELYPNIKICQQDWVDEVERSREPAVWLGGQPTYVTDKGIAAGTGILRSITGRIYTFREHDRPQWLLDKAARRGKPLGSIGFLPTQIKNYPIQGFAGEILRLILGKINRLLLQDGELYQYAKLINCVHDSIVLDIHERVLDKVVRVVNTVFDSTPFLIEKYYKFKFDLPIRADIKIGRNWKDMEEL